jgi:sporulation protein YlmC with PRC-barrel domain
MKINTILTTAVIATLFTSTIYAESNDTKVESTKTEKIMKDVNPPIVGGAIVDISVTTLSTTGYRASKVIGSAVFNEKGEEIGSIDDFIIGGDKEISFAIISVGGFLGLGDRLVAVPAKLFKANKEHKIVLPKATKGDLEALPAFKYAK